jgi:hypothetical protein
MQDTKKKTPLQTLCTIRRWIIIEIYYWLFVAGFMAIANWNKGLLTSLSDLLLLIVEFFIIIRSLLLVFW